MTIMQELKKEVSTIYEKCDSVLSDSTLDDRDRSYYDGKKEALLDVLYIVNKLLRQDCSPNFNYPDVQGL